MNKNYKIIIFLIIILVVIATIIFSLEKNNGQKIINANKEIPKNDDILVSIISDRKKDGYLLLKTEKSEILSTDLLLDIVIDLKKNNNQLISVDIDEINLFGQGLSSDFVKIKSDDNKIQISPKYITDPTNHDIKVKYKNSENNIISYNYPFLLIYYDDFSNTEKTKKMWSEPFNTVYPENLKWVLKENKLVGISTSGSQTANKKSSWSFIRRVSGDINFEFNLKTTSDRASLVAFFLESRSHFIIGNNSSSRISDSSGKNTSFLLEKNKNYYFKVKREKNVYTLTITPENKSEESILTFEGGSIPRLDTIGFSIWDTSDGLEINQVKIWWEKEN